MSLDRPCVHWNDGYCQKFSDNEAQSWCVEGPCEYEQPSHADRIRAMNDEELAKWIDWLFGRCEWCDTDKMATDDCNDVECTSCILEWLKQPAE